MTRPLANCSVLVVDDSAFMRKLISDMIATQPGFHVVGSARNGIEALARIDTLDPDIVTLDLQMPELDGMLTLERIMAHKPRPVIVLSAGGEQFGDATMRALELGAIDFVRKPAGPISLELGAATRPLAEALVAASRARHHVSLRKRPSEVIGSAAERPRSVVAKAARAVVVIASSTGGPRALAEVIPSLPAELGAAVIVAQHLPREFTKALVARLNAASAMSVQLATDGDAVNADCVYIAAGGVDTVLVRDRNACTFSTCRSDSGVTPSADALFASAAATFGSQVVGVVLTGMGRDGAVGLNVVRRAGGWGIVQDEQSSAIYGMPRAALALAGSDRVASLSEMAGAIVAMVSQERKEWLTA